MRSKIKYKTRWYLLLRRVVAVLPALGLAMDVAAESAERRMNVRQGPETVFAEAPATIFAELAGAVPTGRNGRVGNELVFWGFRLGDGQEVQLTACLMVSGVDCEARLDRVCAGPARTLASAMAPGLVRRIRCRSIANAGVGDRHPGCIDREQPEPLAVNLIQCL